MKDLQYNLILILLSIIVTSSIYTVFSLMNQKETIKEAVSDTIGKDNTLK